MGTREKNERTGEKNRRTRVLTFEKGEKKDVGSGENGARKVTATIEKRSGQGLSQRLLKKE